MLSQLRLRIKHIPGIKNELYHHISRQNFDALIQESSEELAQQAFRNIDAQLDLTMGKAASQPPWTLADYPTELFDKDKGLAEGEGELIDGGMFTKLGDRIWTKDRELERVASHLWAHGG